MSATLSLPRPRKSPQAELVQFVRRSKSLASMLPWLLLTGIATLLVTGFVPLLWLGVGYDAGHGVFRRWMEAWLTTWPIAFPIAYLAGPVVARLARTSATAPASRPAGLALSDIEAASARATAKNDLNIMRKRIRTFEVA